MLKNKYYKITFIISFTNIITYVVSMDISNSIISGFTTGKRSDVDFEIKDKSLDITSESFQLRWKTKMFNWLEVQRSLSGVSVT